jgi:hypothetical protein
VRIVDKKKIDSIKKAVVAVSGHGEAELRISRDHTVTPWASLGMYLISKEGETANKTASHYGRKYGAVHSIRKKIDADPDRYKPYLDKIHNWIESCG